MNAFRAPLPLRSAPRARHVNGACARQRRAARGFTLIEVLVSLLVFSLGVLGAVGMQARATQFSVDASERARAALMANEVVSAMWAAGSTSLDSDVKAALADRVGDGSISGHGLPEGELDIEEGSDGEVTITITWQSVSRGSGAPSSSYMTQVVVPETP